MSLALFLLLMSVPLGILVTVAPSWVDADGGRVAIESPSPPPGATTWPLTEDSSHHPATCLAIASHRARVYLEYVTVRGPLEDLDPMTWLVAGRLRDRFETAMLGAIGALHDWLSAMRHTAGVDPRTPLEREALHATLAALIGALPSFSVGHGPEHHYRPRDLARVCVQLEMLSAGMERHRQAALHPSAAPFR